MKKLFSFVVFLLLLFSLAGCVTGVKTALTSENFQNYFDGNASFLVGDMTYQCEGFNVISGIAADNIEKGYALELYVFGDENSALSMYNETLDIISQFVKEPIIENGDNYTKYSGSSSSTFWAIIKVENTVLYCETSKGNQEEVLKIVKDLGY